ncbi:MAG: trypsin-like peptidase domain-containing protein [Candidatus Poribacteria bacterium]|nr:trypsin-like peptidase domain-containing protein [Candidatus Poribacteria bacterium]
MKQNSKFLWISLVLTVLLSCTQNLEQITEKVRNATVRIIDDESGEGSGFFIAPDKIVTNIHVLAGDQSVNVYGSDGTKIVDQANQDSVSVIGYDPAHDLVILQVLNKQKGTPLSLSTSRIGEPIFVTGYKDGKYKVTGGIVYSINDKRIRHDAKTSGGRSGGPVLNIKGKVIGITVGSDGTTLSTAIPSNNLTALMRKSKSGRGQSLDKWQKEDSVRAYVRYKSGIKKCEVNKYKEAITDFKEAITLYPLFADACRNLGNVRNKLGDSNNKNVNVEEARRLVEEARRLYGEAIDDLTKNLDDAYDYYQLASVKLDLGKLEANSKDGDEKDAIKHYQEAIKYYKTSIDMQNPDYPIVLESAYLLRAETILDLGELETDKEVNITLHKDARFELTEAINLKPVSAKSFYLNRGAINTKLGKFHKDQNISEARYYYYAGIKDFEVTIKLNKNIYYAHRNLAYVKCLLGRSFESEGGKENMEHALNLYKETIADSTESIKLNPNQSLVYSIRGIAKASIGDFDGAITDLDKAIDLNPKFAQAYMERGLIRQKIGRQKKAEADFKKAKELDPDIETK